MRRLQLTVILIASSLGMAHAAENNATVVGGLDFGFKKLRLEVGKDSNGEGGGSFHPSYVTINPNFALGYKSFYASLSYDKSISADPGIGSDNNGAAATLLDFSRIDTTLTFGYRLNQSFSIFAGYTKGANEFTETSVNTVLVVKEINYTEKGPFAGVAYTSTFGDKGTLGLSLGYAKLDGELKIVTHGGPAKPDQISKGDNTGLSYSVTWSGPLTGSMNYRAGLKGTRYKMPAGPDNPQDITERYTTFFLGLVNYF